jgi:ribonuclease HII
MLREERLTALERRLRTRGFTRIAGIDEAGRGSLAGPVVAACVVLPEGASLPGVRDSKKLSPLVRARLLQDIERVALDIAIGTVDPGTIDELNILRATHLAMHRAISRLQPPPHYVLVDGRPLPDLSHPQIALVGGDDRCLCIAAASIVAKVTRDRLMIALDGTCPGYGLARHKGYGTQEHIACLERLGPSPIHRRSFRPVAALTCRA